MSDEQNETSETDGEDDHVSGSEATGGSSDELYLDYDQMNDGDRFVVGVAVRLSVSALGRALSTADVHTAENSGPFKFDSQVIHNQTSLTWT